MAGVGDEIKYTMEVTNTGNTCLRDMVVSDDVDSSIECPGSTAPSIAGVALISAPSMRQGHRVVGRERGLVSHCRTLSSQVCSQEV